MMSNIPFDRDHLLAYVDGTLSPEQRAEVESVAQHNMLLQREIAALRSLERNITATVNNAAMYPVLRPAVWQQIDRQIGHKRYLGVWPQLAYSTLLIGAMLIGTLMFRSVHNTGPMRHIVGEMIPTTPSPSLSVSPTVTPFVLPPTLIPTPIQTAGTMSMEDATSSPTSENSADTVPPRAPDAQRDGKRLALRQTIGDITVDLQWVYTDGKRIVLAYRIHSAISARYTPQLTHLSDAVTHRRSSQVAGYSIDEDIFGTPLLAGETAHVQEFSMLPVTTALSELKVHVELYVAAHTVSQTPYPLPAVTVDPDGSVGQAAILVPAIEPTPTGPRAGPFIFDFGIPIPSASAQP